MRTRKWKKNNRRKKEKEPEVTEAEPSEENAIERSREIDTTDTNLSSYELTKEQKDLLSKGLNFIPDRTKIDKIKLLADLAEWERRMRIRDVFFTRKRV